FAAKAYLNPEPWFNSTLNTSSQNRSPGTLQVAPQRLGSKLVEGDELLAIRGSLDTDKKKKTGNQRDEAEEG
ncbi:Enhancer of mRNA-decapping protein 3, partial [Clarias magur]